jgi:hypothetical protein
LTMDFTLGKSLKNSRVNRTQPVFNLLLRKKPIFQRLIQLKNKRTYIMYFRVGYRTQINDSTGLLQKKSRVRQTSHAYAITRTHSTGTSKRITRIVLAATRRIAPSERRDNSCRQLFPLSLSLRIAIEVVQEHIHVLDAILQQL